MSKTNFRLLRPSDASMYRGLRLKSYQEASFAFSESYEDEIRRSVADFEQELAVEGTPPEQFVLGALNENSQLVGFVKFRRDKRSKARHKSMIHAMYIDPAYRATGLGKRILDALMERIQELKDLEQIHLWVLHAEGHKSASGFYTRCGWESQGTRVRKDLKIGDRYIDAEYMVKYL